MSTLRKECEPDTPRINQRSEHAIVDYWRDVVITCRCGAVFARRTRAEAEAEYRSHRETGERRRNG